jgi:uncharacterized PurR-regulated membrane protein YhhQ (DUF165 family)
MAIKSKAWWTVGFYLGSILLANLLVIWFGIVKIGPVVAPAGALVIGLTFSARDFVQRSWGKWPAWGWMVTASIITMFFSRDVAVASVAAFLASEAVDWLVYILVGGPLRRRIFWSNLFGTPLDSLIFVPMVFGWIWPAIIGQAIIKLLGSFLVLPFVWRQGGE